MRVVIKKEAKERTLIYLYFGINNGVGICSVLNLMRATDRGAKTWRILKSV